MVSTRAEHGWSRYTVGIDPAGWSATVVVVEKPGQHVEENNMRDVIMIIIRVGGRNNHAATSVRKVMRAVWNRAMHG